MSLKVLPSLLGGKDIEAECSRSPWSISRCSSHGRQSSCYFRKQQHWSGKSSSPLTVLSYSRVECARRDDIIHTLTHSPVRFNLSVPSVYETEIEFTNSTLATNEQTWALVDLKRVSTGRLEGHFLSLFSSPIIAIITLNYYCNSVYSYYYITVLLKIWKCINLTLL